MPEENKVASPETTTTTTVTAGKGSTPATVQVKTVTTSPLRELGYWTAGVIGAFISGAAGAVSGGMGGMIVAPETFNIHEGLGKVVQLALATAVIPGIVSLAKYLNLHPVPKSWDGTPEGDRRNA